jgi:hypothetical protein
VGAGATVGTVGVITYYGDGSQLTGTGGVSISTNTTNRAQFLTYAVSTGSTTGLGVTTSGLVYNPSTTRLGIGTTNPLFTVDVAAGDVRVQTTNKMRFGGTSSTTNFYIQYNSTTNSLDFVSG